MKLKEVWHLYMLLIYPFSDAWFFWCLVQQVLTQVLEEAGYTKNSLLVLSDFMKVLCSFTLNKFIFTSFPDTLNSFFFFLKTFNVIMFWKSFTYRLNFPDFSIQPNENRGHPYVLLGEMLKEFIEDVKCGVWQYWFLIDLVCTDF